MNYPLEVDGQLYSIAAVSMGNPHAVLRVDDVHTAPVHELGPKIENHPRFPQRVNAGFLQVIDRHRANLRVWERGAGETRPVAPAPAPQPWPPSARAGWTLRCPSTCQVAV